MTLARIAAFSRTERVGQLAFVVLFCGLAIAQLWSEILPYFLEGQGFTFRVDNFWAYSSGFTRRALPGEVIYRLDLLTGAGPLIFSLVTSGCFLMVLFVVMREVLEFTDSRSILLLCAGPIFLNFGVDAEVYVLMPALYAILVRPKPNLVVMLVLIGLSVAIREIALLFYLPVLAMALWRGRAVARLLAIAILGGFVWSVVVRSVPITFHLEMTYWPLVGLENLHHGYLYNFAGKPLSEVLGQHAKWIAGNKHALLGAVLFLAVYLWVLYARSRSVGLTIYMAAVLIVTAILTVDYGRYYYVFFFFAVLVTSPAMRDLVPTNKADGFLDKLGVGKVLHAGFSRLAGMRWILLALLCLAPSGSWVDATSYLPRIFQVMR